MDCWWCANHQNAADLCWCESASKDLHPFACEGKYATGERPSVDAETCPDWEKRQMMQAVE